jgi:predicted outer membrane protein
MTRPPVGTIGILALAAALVAALAMGAVPASAAPVVPAQLNAADMTLLNGVRLAGLWEIPAGQMAAERGSLPQIRKIGASIAAQHVQLDQLVVDAANKLGASIPATPTAEQQGWLGEMQKATGARFDQIFVDRLRAAHGKIFPVIGAVRAGTRDPVIRKLADQATIFVMNHMKMLESTGIVRYDKLAPAALPAAQDTSTWALARANAGSGSPLNSALLWIVLTVGLGLATVVTVRVAGGRGAQRYRAVERRQLTEQGADRRIPRQGGQARASSGRLRWTGRCRPRSRTYPRRGDDEE